MYPAIFSGCLLFAVCMSACAAGLDEEPAKPGAVQLPGLLINLPEACVDVEATVCLDKGMLELVACSRGTKEHESIFSVKARPMHLHTALLLIGAENGSPAHNRPVDPERTRWVPVPATGDRIAVFLVLPDQNQKQVEHPLHEFVLFSRERVDEVDGQIKASPSESDGNPERSRLESRARFPGSFVFSGSLLREREQGPRNYVADSSGHVISIATFGDEVLSLPTRESRSNATLSWRIRPGSLPPVGTRVILRLRKVKSPKEGTGRNSEKTLDRRKPIEDPT